MPKGGKPSPSSFLPIEEVAQTLKVQPSQILEWMQKDQLRGNDSGIKPYDLKKFQLDHQDEIRKAQARALKDGQKPVEAKKPAKSGGFFSRFFGGGKKADDDFSDGGNQTQEIRRLQDELRKARSEAPDPVATVQLEDKVKFLEGKLAKVSGLESEISDLRRRLAEGGGAGPSSPDPELARQLEAARRELVNTQEMARQATSLQAALHQAEEEREALRAELSQQQNGSGAPTEFHDQLEATRQALQDTEARLQSVLAEEEARDAQWQNALNEREEIISSLRHELKNAESPPAAASSGDEGSGVLVGELLALQETNLVRFSRLHDLYHQAQAKLAQAPSSGGDSVSEANFQRLQSEFETLRVKHQSLLEARETNVPGHQEFVEQLAAARATTTRLKQENSALKSRLSEADVEGWKQKVDELTQRVQGSRANDASLELVETELRAVRKSLQSREAQVQKIAGRLQENERALKKALKESTRLTELLIERENRLRDLSTEYEQEYRDKIDNLDRQVSGLQWKLSLREERIASLESEVSDLRKSKG